MREAFTDQLRSVLDRAQASARRMNRDFVGTEDLLLGAIECDGCSAAQAFRLNEIDLDELRENVVAELPRTDDPPVVTGDLPLSPKAKRVINSALVKTQTLHEPTVSTRLLVLALLESEGPDSVINQALRECGADIDQLQRILAQPPAQPES